MKKRIFNLFVLIVGLAVLLGTSGVAAQKANQNNPYHPWEDREVLAAQQQAWNVGLVGQIDVPGGSAHGVAVAGNYAYVAGGMGIRIIDISNPAAPSETGFYDTPGLAQELAVAGNYVYVADYHDGLRIINVSNPAAPSETGFYDTPGIAIGVTVSGNYAYVADGLEGLRIIDVSNPAAPSESGFHDTPGSAHGVEVAGNYAYVADGLEGLRIIDVSDPAAPSESGFYDTQGEVLGVAVSGNYAFVADGFGLRIVDVSNPAAPSEAGFYDTPESLWDVVVNESIAHVAGGEGIRIIDVSDPAAPSEVGFYFPSQAAEDVALGGIYTYDANGSKGLLILRYSPYWTYLPVIVRPCVPLFNDDFSNPSSGWSIEDDGNVRYEYLNSEYRILVRNTDWWAAARPGFQISDYILEADVRNVSGTWGSYGLMFDISSDWSQFYTFEIFPNGYYGIYFYNSGTWTTLIEQAKNINTGTAINRLKIIRNGNYFSAYANGLHLVGFDNVPPTGVRYVGLFAGTYDKPNLDVRFDDFVVNPVNCSVAADQSGIAIQDPNLESLDAIEQGQIFSQSDSRKR
jgi:hypothetical protein